MPVTEVRDYFTTELARNHENAALYTRMMQIAFGAQDDEMIGHHLSFQEHGKLDTLQEIPSADTLIFDHYVMSRVFGYYAIKVMQHLASVPFENGERDALLGSYLRAREGVKPPVEVASWREATDKLAALPPGH